jgi:hypothetical protein
MRATDFDGTTQDLGAVSTRRSVLRLVGGAVAVATVGATYCGPVSAKRKRGKKKPGKTNPGQGQPQPQPVACTSWILSGGANPTTPIQVDDDLTLKVNGVTVFSDSDGMARPVSPVVFAAQVGDQLDVDASDVNPACRAISALWLHCATTGQKRQLSDGTDDGCAPGRTPGVFFGGAYRVGV